MSCALESGFCHPQQIRTVKVPRPQLMEANLVGRLPLGGATFCRPHAPSVASTNHRGVVLLVPDQGEENKSGHSEASDVATMLVLGD